MEINSLQDESNLLCYCDIVILDCSDFFKTLENLEKQEFMNRSIYSEVKETKSIKILKKNLQ